MSNTNTVIVSESDLALTYDPGVEGIDAWELVRQHEAALRYAAANPNAGPTAIGRAIGAPRHRVREWVDREQPARPDAARGLETALNNGWVPISLESEPDDLWAWITLAAGLLAGGSLNRDFTPKWAPHSSRERTRIIDALEHLGVEWQYDHQDADGKATEIAPLQSRVLGRIFDCLGVPSASKVELGRLPNWVRNISSPLREQFAVVYVGNRAESRYPKGDSHGGVRLREQRPDSYLEDLAAFFESVTDEKVSTSGENNVYISADALDKIVAFESRGPSKTIRD